MAKRRQLEIPSPETLKELEDGFARETPRAGTRAPIADVAADAASRADPLPQHLREENARDRADAKAMREAREKGLVLTELAVADIEADALTRDRMAIDAEEMAELKQSIMKSGMRMPIEVFALEEPGRYGLISGYRRLTAMRELDRETVGPKYATISAFVRSPETLADAVVSMIEENEVRAQLSQYERGRAAAVAVHLEVFKTLDDAVNTMFATASKAKRSKIRSFALVHEELGDMLRFGRELNERQILRIATGLRSGNTEAMRRALERHQASDPASEWAVLEPHITQAELVAPDPTRGGRPKKVIERGPQILLSNGIQIERVTSGDGFAIRLRGEGLDESAVDYCIEQIKGILEDR
ncbi:ParB/RepB/Spo0J family partition protein [Aestuariivita boseongensis]|uniref:ParB/RepB/Spo0J family partition protein n=1 Tax=Aestuariivita boseongensis TaxID=1470562 RepID=UPI000681B88B|nr:ParB N-terminal domain-containing protein [Aestuariivita boseongensis]